MEGGHGPASGIYRSDDGGVSWQPVLTGAPGTAVVFDPVHPNTVYAALGSMNGDPSNGVYKSTDAGVHWASANGNQSGAIPVASAGRISLALCAAQPQVIYAAMQDINSNNPLDIFKTTDGGQTWQSFAAPSYCYGNCWYANVIQVHPTEANVVLVAGMTFYLSQDGGVTWNSVLYGANDNLVHWDVHALTFSGDGARLYVGGDGGAYSSDRVDTTPPADIGWKNLNDTLALTQFYPGCSVNPADPDFMLCGTQDNGVQLYTGSPIWLMIYSGDGGWTALDSARPSVFYVTQNTNFIDVEKTSPFGQFRGLYPVIYGIDPNDYDPNYIKCSFTPPLVLDPADPLRLYFGSNRVYQSEDGGGLWTPISGDLGSHDGNPGYIAALAVAPGDSGRVYAATSNGRVHVASNATAGADAIWDERSDGLPPRAITALVVSPANPDVAYAASSGFSGFDDSLGHIFKTVDAGAQWTDISSNLPNIPVNAIALDPDLPGVVYIGTDIGVFRTVDDGGSWMPLGQGLPRVAVLDLKFQASARLLRAATHGRSMWELQLPSVRTAVLPLRIVSATPLPQSSGGSNFSLSLNGSGFGSDAKVRWNGIPQATTFMSESQLRVTIPATAVAPAGRASLAVRAAAGVSNVYNLDLGPAPQVTAVVNAANPLSTAPLAPGTVATITGVGLGATTASATTTPWPQTLAGATVEIRDRNQHASVLAPISSVSPGQITFLVPWSLSTSDAQSLSVVQGTRMSDGLGLSLDVFSPGLYSTNGQGTGQGWIVCAADGMLAGPPSAGSHPVSAGDSVILFATGLGPVAASSTPSDTVSTPQVSIGGVPAGVTSAQLAPGVVGLYEVTVVVPAAGPGDAVHVVLTAGKSVSNTVTMAIW